MKKKNNNTLDKTIGLISVHHLIKKEPKKYYKLYRNSLIKDSFLKLLYLNVSIILIQVFYNIMFIVQGSFLQGKIGRYRFISMLIIVVSSFATLIIGLYIRKKKSNHFMAMAILQYVYYAFLLVGLLWYIGAEAMDIASFHETEVVSNWYVSIIYIYTLLIVVFVPLPSETGNDLFYLISFIGTILIYKGFLKKMPNLVNYFALTLEIYLLGRFLYTRVANHMIVSFHLHLSEVEAIERSRKIVLAFSNIVENRDESTGEHTKRSVHYVELILKELVKQKEFTDILTNNYCRMCRLAASLHDIGKIAISDSILNKPARLTEDEFDIMKNHTTLGKKMIQQNLNGIESDDYIAMASDIAMYHHEWYNGSGYPEGKKKDEIPLSARIMACADVYDALTTNRVYRKAISSEEALKFMEQERGTHFDPTVLDAFIACKNQFN
jgi:HD-GYP domain-containing protein (c-di-GMP phosphodiesterase class II)